MTVEEIYTKLCTHMKEGILYHSEFVKAYEFLGLLGYAKCQRYHQMEEEINYCKLETYYMEHELKLLTLENITAPDIIPTSWYKYNTLAVDVGTKRSAVKELINRWVNWETETKKLYQEMRQELYNIGEVAAALNLDKYIHDVDKELCHAKKQLIDLETIGYDIIKIIEWQEGLYKKYTHKLGW